MDACLAAVDRKIWRRIQFVLKIFLASNAPPHRYFCFRGLESEFCKIRAQRSDVSAGDSSGRRFGDTNALLSRTEVGFDP